MLVRKRACPGTLSPVRWRFLASMAWRISQMLMRLRPTSMSVPTMARTILRRKRLAEMVKRHSPGFSSSQRASWMIQMLVFTSVPVLLNEVKSEYSSNTWAA